jgi:glutaredoxin
MKLTVYTKPFCSHCDAAKRLIESHDYSSKIELEYVDITDVAEARSKLIAAGLKSLPQFYINDKLIEGGWHNFKQISSEELLLTIF